MTDALVLGLGADAHAFLARVRARHHHAAGRGNRTKEAAMTRSGCRRRSEPGQRGTENSKNPVPGSHPSEDAVGGGCLNGNHIESRLRERRQGRHGSDHGGDKRKSAAAIRWSNCLPDLAGKTKSAGGRRALSSRSPARWSGLAAGLGAAKTRLSDSQGETPNSFSISDIIGCVKPALRNAAKSAAMTRSHSLASCCDIGLPL